MPTNPLIPINARNLTVRNLDDNNRVVVSGPIEDPKFIIPEVGTTIKVDNDGFHVHASEVDYTISTAPNRLSMVINVAISKAIPPKP